MKSLMRLLVVLMMGSAYAQSNLPACPTSGYFHNCFGKYTDPNGDQYVGEWKDGKQNGQGSYTFPNGQKYVGNFKDGEFSGQGTYTFSDGSKYVGEWKRMRNGQGTLTLANGNKYVGEFKDNEFYGQGTYNYADGSKYVGEWKDSKRNGQGTHTFSSGDKYVGEFKDGNWHGRGTILSSDGSIISQGIFADNKLISSGQAQQATVPNQENERLRAEVSEAKKKQAESEEKVSITQQQIPQTNDLRSRNLAINWRLETFGGNLGNSYCQASNITYNGRDTNDGSAIFWVVVDCRTSRSGTSGGQYRFCGINHQEIMRQTGFTSVCRKN